MTFLGKKYFNKTDKRQLSLEPLEKREMLSVSPGEMNPFDSTLNVSTAYEAPLQTSSQVGSTAASLSASMASDAPSNLKVVSATGTSVTLSWTINQAGATVSCVDCSTDGVNWTTKNVLTNSLATGSTTITGLSPDTEYQFRIRTGYSDTPNWAPGTNHHTAYSDVLSVKTAIVSDAAPSNFTVVSTTGTSVTLSWTKNQELATVSCVSWSSDGGKTWSAEKIFNPNGPATITGLSPNTEYQFRVRTGYSDTSNWAPGTNHHTAFSVISATTATQSDAPTNFKVVSETGTSVTLSWEINQDKAQVSCIDYSADGGKTWTTQNVVTNGLATGSTTITGLTQGVTYQFRIRTGWTEDDWKSGHNHYTDWTSSITVTLSDAPTNFKVESTEGTSVTLSWQINQNLASVSCIDYSTDGGKTWVTTKTTNVARKGSETTGSTTITGLTQGVTYLFRIRTGYTSSGSWVDGNNHYTAWTIGPSVKLALDYSSLEAAIKTITDAKYNSTDFAKDSFDSLTAAVTEGYGLLDNAANQAQITDAAAAILTAQKNLVDVSSLRKQVDDAIIWKINQVPADYNDADWTKP